MKFSLCVLLTALMVATAAAGPSFNRDLFGKGFGILTETNLAQFVTPCSEPGAGVLLDLRIKDCDQVPCKVVPGQIYHIKYTLECGLQEILWELDVVIEQQFSNTLAPQVDKSCLPGDIVTLEFSLEIPEFASFFPGPGNYSTEFILFGTDGIQENRENCFGMPVILAVE